MNINDLVRRTDQLIKMGEAVLATQRTTGGQYSSTSVDIGLIAGFRSASLSFIERVYGRNHPHFEEFSRVVDKNHPTDAGQGIEILKAIRSEIEGGWLLSVKGLVAAELFADFLEMAEHFLTSGYKDAAAVMAGSVLEEHLRQLCGKNGVAVEEDKGGDLVAKKADRLNADLAKAEVYSKLDQKMITAWLDLRNNAAHGKYDQYNAEQVKGLISGVVEFMTRVSV